HRPLFAAPFRVKLYTPSLHDALPISLFGNPQVEARWSWWQMALGSLVILAAVILAIRGTLGHRPINPSTVAYSNDGLLNTLALKDRKSTRLNSSHVKISYAVFCLKKK